MLAIVVIVGFLILEVGRRIYNNKRQLKVCISKHVKYLRISQWYCRNSSYLAVSMAANRLPYFKTKDPLDWIDLSRYSGPIQSRG